jgi:capsular polysaccharide biosynthesis protein
MSHLQIYVVVLEFLDEIVEREAVIENFLSLYVLGVGHDFFVLLHCHGLLA